MEVKGIPLMVLTKQNKQHNESSQEEFTCMSYVPVCGLDASYSTREISLLKFIEIIGNENVDRTL